MPRLLVLLALLFLTGVAFAQTSSEEQPTPFYPAQPPKEAPKIEQGAPLKGLSSPLAAGEQKITRTAVASDTEAQMFANARKVMWGRIAKGKGTKPGDVVVTKQDGLWSVKGRIESTAAETEGDWAAIDAVVERIAANHITVRGEVAFRVAKLQGGKACKAAGTLHFKRSGKSQVWRLVEDDNPCDGTQELFDLIYEKPVEKKPVPAGSAKKG